MNRTSTVQQEIEREVIESANEWAARLPEYAELFEQQNRLTPDIARQFAKAGFFRMNVPQEYGGLEVHPRTMVEVIKRLQKVTLLLHGMS